MSIQEKHQMYIERTYPLRVTFHKGGEYNLLFWSTWNEGTHMIMARRESSIIPSIRAVIKKVGIPELKAFWKINVVAPTTEMKKRAAWQAYSHEMWDFKAQFGYELSEYMNDKRNAGKADLCQNYKNRFDDESEDENSDALHHFCANCLQGYKIKGQSIESLFLVHGSKYSSPNPFKANKQSVAQQPDTNKDIYYLDTSNFGHHRTGLLLNKVDEATTYNNIIFFFQGSKQEMPKAFSNECSVAEQAHEARKKMDAQYYQAKRKIERQKLVDRVESILGAK